MKRGQISIFIIVGIIIISAIALTLIFRSGIAPEIGKKPETNPNPFLESCIEDKVKEGIEKISIQGGYITHSLNKPFKFEDEKETIDISYLCYTQSYYVPCINQEPVLIKHLTDELEEYISDEVKNCLDGLSLSLDKEGYNVDAKYNGFDVALMPKKVSIELDNKMILTKAGETSIKEDFKVLIPTRFYDLALVVQEIISQEAEYCHFETLGYMLFYPQFDIDKFTTGDSTIIYTIEHRDSKERFRFAVRSCVMPPGF